jgi:hypothetical protein
MSRTLRVTAFGALLVLLAGGAMAETLTVTLDNGNSILTRYRPKLSPDGATAYLLTDMGNWVSFDKAAIVSVVSDLESRGFGKVIDTTTISLGIAPNSRDVGEGGTGELDGELEMLNYLRERDAARDNYSVPQFVQPEEATGIPMDMINQTTPPIGYNN